MAEHNICATYATSFDLAKSPRSPRSSTISSLSETEGEEYGMGRPGGLHADPIPALRMSRVSVMQEDILRSVRDILTTARVDATTSRTARHCNSAVLPSPLDADTAGFWRKKAVELERELQQMEDKVTECSEKGLELVDKIITLEDRLEDQEDNHTTNVQEFKDRIMELESSKNTYMASSLYISEEFRRKDSMLEEAKTGQNEEERRAEAMLSQAKWVEQNALATIREAKMIVENCPTAEAFEMEERIEISNDERDEWAATVADFASRCAHDATYLYRVLRKFEVQFNDVRKPRIASAALASNDSFTISTPAPPECIVFKQSSYLRVWRARSMTVTYNAAEPRLDFYEPAGRHRLRAFISLFNLTNVDLGTSVPRVGHIAGKYAVTEYSWQHGVKLTAANGVTLFISMKNVAEVEAWVQFFQQFIERNQKS